MTTFAEKVIAFNKQLHYNGDLPENIRILNPFQESAEALTISTAFYQKYYTDHQPRKFIIGINPGRFGAGVTGVPFTDTKRLNEVCGIPVGHITTHEPSSVFVYNVVEQYGGPAKFYADFYINSVCPLGFIRLNEKNNWVNCNYYDFKELYRLVENFMVQSLKQQLDFGLQTDTAYVMGKKNEQYLQHLNRRHKFFNRIIQIPHPRYIVQYKSKLMTAYVDEYLRALKM